MTYVDGGNERKLVQRTNAHGWFIRIVIHSKNVENSRLFPSNDVTFQFGRRQVCIRAPLIRCVPIAVADVSRWGFENTFFDLHMWRSTFWKLKTTVSNVVTCVPFWLQYDTVPKRYSLFCFFKRTTVTARK